MRGRLAEPAFLFVHFGPLATKNKRRGTSFAPPNVVSSSAVVGARRFGTVLCREVLRTCRPDRSWSGHAAPGLGAGVAPFAAPGLDVVVGALGLRLCALGLWSLAGLLKLPALRTVLHFIFSASGPLTWCPAPPRAGVWPFQATSAARDRAEPLKKCRRSDHGRHPRSARARASARFQAML
jgi:hypothetical protein